MYFIMTWHNSGSSFNRLVPFRLPSVARYNADTFAVQIYKQQRTIEVINGKLSDVCHHIWMSLWCGGSAVGGNTMNFAGVCCIQNKHSIKNLSLTSCINKWLNITLNYSRDDLHFKSIDSFHHSICFSNPPWWLYWSTQWKWMSSHITLTHTL